MLPLPHKDSCSAPRLLPQLPLLIVFLPSPRRCSCVRPDESSLTNRCHYLADGSCVFALTIRRAGARRGQEAG